MTDQSHAPLLPCPFCGGDAGYFASQQAVFRAEWVGHVYHCTKCQARVQNTDRQTAQSMWNTRSVNSLRTTEHQDAVKEIERLHAQLAAIEAKRLELASHIDGCVRVAADALKRAEAAEARLQIARNALDAYEAASLVTYGTPSHIRLTRIADDMRLAAINGAYK